MSAIWQQATKVASQTKGRTAATRLPTNWAKNKFQHGDLTSKEKSIQKELTTANKNEHLQTEMLKVKEASNKFAAEVKVLPEQVHFKRALVWVVNVPPSPLTHPLTPTVPMTYWNSIIQVRAAKGAGFVPKRSHSRVKSLSKCTKCQQRNIKQRGRQIAENQCKGWRKMAI